MATITVTLSSHVNHAGKSEILMRFSGGRNCTCRIKSGLFVAPNRWSAKDGHFIIPRIETLEQRELLRLQRRLDDLRQTLIESYTVADKSKVTKEWFVTEVERFHHPEHFIAERTDLFDAFDAFDDRHKVSPARAAHYQVLRRLLHRYEVYADTQLILDNITSDTIDDIVSFCRTEHLLYINPKYSFIYERYPETRKIEPRGENTIGGLLKLLRSLFLWSNRNGYTTNNPFALYKIPEGVYGTPYYITIDERNLVYRLDLSQRPSLAVQRDIFVFQCLIGCRVGDLVKMKRSNIIGGAIEYYPRKTKGDRPVRVRVPLNATARAIVDRYADGDDDRLLPFISEQKYNVAIKEIFRIAGLTRWVTVLNPTTREEEKRRLCDIASSHLARRTFIGNLYKQVKDPNLVGALSGHKEGSKAFARYRDIDEEMRIDLVNLLEK